MRIAAIGIGNVGGALARKWAVRGHDMALGARDASSGKARELAQTIGPRARILAPAEAAAWADVVCLATPWANAEEAIRSLGDLSGKTVIDCTNPLKSDLSGLTHGFDVSGGELVQRWAQGAHVVKCFNTVGFNIMENPVVDGRKSAMFYCGDQQPAKDRARALAEDIGFEAIDAGPLSSARLLEPFALLWISSAYRFGLGREFAFTISRR